MTKMTLSPGRSSVQKSNFFKKFAVISGQFLIAYCLILFSSKVSYADVICTMTPSPGAAQPDTVLMLASTLADSSGNLAGSEVDLCTSLDATRQWP